MLVVNGEIYNYQALSEELKGLCADEAEPMARALSDELAAIVRADVLRWPTHNEEIGQAMRHFIRP